MRLPKWIFAALVPCLAVGVAADVAAFDLDASEYSLYETAPRTDGCRWLYIVPKSPLRILAADVPTPLLSSPDTTGFRGTLCGDGSVRDWRKEAVSAEDMTSLAYRATPSPMKLLGGDFDGDGKPDFLLQAADRSHPSQVFIADKQGLPRRYVSANAGVATADVAARTVAAVPMAAAGAAQVSTVAATDTTAFAVGLVGPIDGKFRVDESGAATYGVDILAAPGTAGVTPRISLNYASNMGDGIAGPGWSIGGLSAIERCPQTPVQDGNATAVSLSANDRFCLDGQRLILASGVYGGNGSTYRTEIDSYAVITAYGRVVGHPQYFTVRRKDGSLSYYGDGAAQGTNNSSPAVGIGGSVLRWGISRFQDSVGNGMRFQYVGDGVASDHRIARIDYAYGATVGNASNSTTFLQFDYQARPDTSSGYVAGLRLDRTQRLVAIRSFSDGTELRNYNLVYRAPDGVHRQSFVERLHECAGGSCLSPTTFDWKLNQGGFTAGVMLATVGGTQLSTVRTLDINGDGRTDIVYRKLAAPYGLYYRLSNGAGFAEERVLVPATTKSVNLDDLPITIFDIDNDGRQDLLYATAPTTPAILFRGTPDGFAAGAAFDLGMAFPVAADITGDGVPDLAGNTIAPLLRAAQRVASNGSWTTVFGAPQLLAGVDGAGPAPPAGCRALSVWHMPASLMSEGSDFNGDGRVDLPAVADYNNGAAGCTATYAGVAISQGGGGFVSRSWVSGIALPAADMNGDGLADQWYDDGTGNRVLRFSSGVSFAAPIIVGNSTLMQRALYVDYDGDGYPDLLWPSLFKALAVQRFDPAARGYPTAALTPLPFQAATGPFAADLYLSLDIDGDGHADLLRINNHLYGSTLTLYRSADAGGAGNRITGIDNGLGGSTAIAYKPLTDNTVYTVGSDANKVASWPGAPVYDVLAPHYVVARVSIASPLANATVPGAVDHAALRTTEYLYGGFKLQSGGRGALGFAWIKTIDNRDGITNVAWYRQDFPFIGQPLWNLQASSAGISVRSTVSRYGEVAHNGADGTRYYQIYESRREEQVNDPHSGIETSYAVTENAVPDEWGNFSRTVVSTYPAGSHDAWLTQRVVANGYGDATYTRQFGRLAKSIDTYRRAGEPDIERVSSFTYFPAGVALEGLLATERVDTADGAPTHTTSYRYDAFGNKTRVALSAAGEAERYMDTVYDAAGRFVVSRSGEFHNGKDWSPRSIESVTSRNAYGQPLQIRFLNGLVVDYTYDAAGREIAHRENTGVAVRTEYLRGGAVGAQYQKKTTAATGAMAAEFFDALGRRIATAATGFDGRWIWSETEYEAQGRVQRQSEPHYAGEPAYWTRNTWDAFELLRRSAPAAGGTEAATSIARQGLITTTVNALGQKRIEERNAAGELVRATDALGGTVTYLYDAAGQVRQVTTNALQQGRTVSVSTCAWSTTRSAGKSRRSIRTRAPRSIATTVSARSSNSTRR